MLGDRMEVFVYSRMGIEASAPHEVPHVIVSITSAPGDRARLRGNEHTLGVLRLAFLDRDAPSGPADRLFEPDDARAIWGLIRAHPGARRLVVHCDAGLCRSPAVAAAVVRALGGDDEPFFRRYRPNMRVYRTLLEVFHEEPATA